MQKEKCAFGRPKARKENRSFFTELFQQILNTIFLFLCSVKIIPEKISHTQTQKCVCFWNKQLSHFIACTQTQHQYLKKRRGIDYIACVRCKTEQTQWLQNVSTQTPTLYTVYTQIRMRCWWKLENESIRCRGLLLLDLRAAMCPTSSRNNKESY